MKINAGSFTTDMNAMLNDLNHNTIHGYYNKVIAGTDHKMHNIITNMNSQIKAGTSSAKEREHDLLNQMRAFNEANQQMWNHEMPPQVNKAFNLSLMTVPRNTDYYYPSGSQGPSDPQPGDVMWQSDDWDDVGSNDFNAKMFIYYKSAGWKPVKTSTQITGVNINGASIHGGLITGAAFRSGSQGIDGAPFWVNRDGTLYANNFVSDLQHDTEGGINPYVYHGYLRSHEGFAIADGMLQMIAYAQHKEHSGLPIWSDWPAAQGATYLEPGYLKLRYQRDDTGNNYVRSDLRAGLLEVSGNSWNQDKGIKIGYWNAHNGDTPKISFGSWIIGENGGADLDFTGPGNISTYQPIHAHSGLDTNDIYVSGGIKIKNKTIGSKSGVTDLLDEVHENEHKTDDNSGKIYDHGQILDGNDFSDPNNIINGSDNINSHESRLNDHDTKLQNHQEAINQLENTLGNSLMIKVGADGDAQFQDPAGGIAHFTFYQDISTLNNAQVAAGGESGTVIGFTGINFGGSWMNHLGVDPLNNYLQYQGDTLATTGYVRGVAGRGSMLSIKHDILPVSSQKALNDVLNTDIRAWIYNNDNSDHVHVGPIIDDLHSRQNEKYYTPENIIDHDPLNQNYKMINEYDSIGYLYLAIKQLAKQNSHLTQRVVKLELQKQRK